MDPLGLLYKSDALTDANLRPNGAAGNEASVNYDEPQHLEVGADTTATPVVQVQIPLSFVRNSILAMNKDFYFPEILVFRVLWGPATMAAFNATNNNNPVTGAAASAAIALTGINLMLAVEQNPEVAASLVAKVNSGSFSCLVPTVFSSKNFLSGTSQSVSSRYNNGHGRSLVKVYHAAFNATESLNLAMDNDNTSGRIITSYYSALDNTRLQDFNIDPVTLKTDWMIHKDALKGSVILNSAMYQTNWFHCENFSGLPALSDRQLNEPVENIMVGLPLDRERKFDIFMTISAVAAQGWTPSTNGVNHYQFAVLLKMLSIGPGGIMMS